MSDSIEATATGLALLEPPVGGQGARVRSEPLTYARHAAVSYFQDLARKDSDAASQARLARHAAEMRVELAERDKRLVLHPDAEYRTNPNRTDGTGGYFSPPLWLIDQYATAPRPRRAIGDLAPRFALPPGTSQVNVPVVTTGNATGPTNDDAPAFSRDMVDSSTSSTVVTISGQADVALQLLEQSPANAALDWAVFKDLTESYDHQLENLLTAGNGSAAQFTGVTQVANINTVAYTTGSPTLAGLYPLLGQAVARVGNTRLLPPECWLMRSSRWAWIASALDDQHRPIVPPDTSDAPEPPAGGPRPIGALLGRWPVYLSDSISATQGAGANQDQIICLRPSDLLLFESEPRDAVMYDVLSGTLQARIQLHGYAAAITGRYPSGISVISGTGMAVQANF